MDDTRFDEPSQYLTFTLADEVFGIDILSVKEIIEYGGVTDVPMMPRTVRGVINLRGAVVPVVDLLARFGQPSSPVGRRTCIVIVEKICAGEPSHVIGVVVDTVSAVLTIPASAIEPAPGFGMRLAAQFVLGMGQDTRKRRSKEAERDKDKEKGNGNGDDKGRFVILLNLDEVLNLEQLGAMDALSAEVEPVEPD
ncbi:chemotaxis protein CheW [Paraburkholderia sp. ZP32-5]|uniref:chemotaxis protein CheW n=1 Tax=Paraburkholderia sp. ZP32-5 TaxID=2883245 RepID=UPI001F3423FF|nr:chemotaxis protein CheW [Paraburkholderia sp. ZP32-5]